MFVWFSLLCVTISHQSWGERERETRKLNSHILIRTRYLNILTRRKLAQATIATSVVFIVIITVRRLTLRRPLNWWTYRYRWFMLWSSTPMGRSNRPLILGNIGLWIPKIEVSSLTINQAFPRFWEGGVLWCVTRTSRRCSCSSSHIKLQSRITSGTRKSHDILKAWNEN